MATFVLIPGAGGHAAYWTRLIPELEARGHHGIAVDIKENEPSMDLHGFAARGARTGLAGELLAHAQSRTAAGTIEGNHGDLRPAECEETLIRASCPAQAREGYLI